MISRTHAQQKPPDSLYIVCNIDVCFFLPYGLHHVELAGGNCWMVQHPLTLFGIQFGGVNACADMLEVDGAVL